MGRDESRPLGSSTCEIYERLSKIALFHMNRVDVIRDIESAFRSVALEEGIGILEGEAIHNGVSDHDRENARKTDFRQRWQDIPDEVIENHATALCYMDAKGLRFNLPAYMRFALLHYDDRNSDCFDWTIYAVSKEQHDLDHEWAIFSETQKTRRLSR